VERKFVQIKVLQWRREHERVGEEKEEIALQWRTKKKKKTSFFHRWAYFGSGSTSFDDGRSEHASVYGQNDEISVKWIPNESYRRLEEDLFYGVISKQTYEQRKEQLNEQLTSKAQIIFYKVKKKKERERESILKHNL
jgi:hypothetical protein